MVDQSEATKIGDRKRIEAFLATTNGKIDLLQVDILRGSKTRAYSLYEGVE